MREENSPIKLELVSLFAICTDCISYICENIRDISCPAASTATSRLSIADTIDSGNVGIREANVQKYSNVINTASYHVL